MICVNLWIEGVPPMDDMREIITVEQANALFYALAIVGPVVGLIIGTLVGMRSQSRKACILKGLLIGMLGPLNLVLWFVYNAITNRLGLDTVKNLLVNL